jgi:hypothetical protein
MNIYAVFIYILVRKMMMFAALIVLAKNKLVVVIKFKKYTS